MPLTLTEAKRVVDGAIAKARELNVAISAVVCDADGRFIALNRMDGAYATANHESIGKAIAAASWGRASGDAEAVAEHPGTATVVGEGMPVLRRRGALPIIRGGVVEGACGVSGADDETQDEDCARAGLARL